MSRTGIIRGRYIASGGQSMIYLSRRVSDRSLVVEKEMLDYGKDDNLRQNLLRAIHVVLRDVDVFAQILEFPTVDRRSTLLEYCNGGTVQGVIDDYGNQPGKGVPECFIWKVFSDVAAAVSYLHTGDLTGIGKPSRGWNPIVHRDIKPENILLTQDLSNPNGMPKVKLTDFDMSIFYEPSRCTFFAGTSVWQPEEQWADPKKPQARPSGDVYSVGAVIHAMAVGMPPLPDHEAWPVYYELNCEGKKAAIRALPKVVRKLGAMYTRQLEECMDLALRPIAVRKNARELRKRVAVAAAEYTKRVGSTIPQMYFTYQLPLQDWELAEDKPVVGGCPGVGGTGVGREKYINNMRERPKSIVVKRRILQERRSCCVKHV